MGFAFAGLGFFWIILIILVVVFLLIIGGWQVVLLILKLVFKFIYWIFTALFGFLGKKSQQGINKIDTKLKRKRKFS